MAKDAEYLIMRLLAVIVAGEMLIQILGPSFFAVHACPCMCVYADAYGSQKSASAPGVNLRLHFGGGRSRVSHLPGTSQVGQVGWPVSSDLQGSALPELGL